jgi:hypothetical protein
MKPAFAITLAILLLFSISSQLTLAREARLIEDIEIDKQNRNMYLELKDLYRESREAFYNLRENYKGCEEEECLKIDELSLIEGKNFLRSAASLFMLDMQNLVEETEHYIDNEFLKEKIASEMEYCISLIDDAVHDITQSSTIPELSHYNNALYSIMDSCDNSFLAYSEDIEDMKMADVFSFIEELEIKLSIVEKEAKKEGLYIDDKIEKLKDYLEDAKDAYTEEDYKTMSINLKKTHDILSHLLKEIASDIELESIIETKQENSQ